MPSRRDVAAFLARLGVALAESRGAWWGLLVGPDGADLHRLDDATGSKYRWPMDLDVIAEVLDRAVSSLGLDGPLHPWWLGEKRPRRPVRLDGTLAPPCPLPNDLELDRLLGTFLPGDRDAIERQVDEGYEHLVLSSGDTPEPDDDASVVYVKLGLPLVGEDRVLLRVCTRNLHGDGQTVTGDHHAWLDSNLRLPQILTAPQRDLASVWDRWVVGRSPGLRVDVNAATESELLGLPGSDDATVRAILAHRPFGRVDELRKVLGDKTLRAIGRLIDWEMSRRCIAVRRASTHVAPATERGFPSAGIPFSKFALQRDDLFARGHGVVDDDRRGAAHRPVVLGVDIGVGDRWLRHVERDVRAVRRAVIAAASWEVSAN
jgi:hypothetical protein